MITFSDGPASGQHLMLKRAPFLLRVTEEGGKWDALDQPTDTPHMGEAVYAYKMDLRCGGPGWCHIRAAKREASGFYAMATYRFIEPQPAEAVLWSKKQWIQYCEQFREEWEEWNARAKTSR